MSIKKIIAIISIIITFFIIYFLQTNFFSWFTIANIKPNLFVIFILIIGLFVGKKLGFAFGILFGIYLDLISGNTIGITGVMLAIVGLLGEYLEKNFSKSSRITIMFMVAGATALFEIGSYAFQILQSGVHIELIPFAKILLIEIIFNSILIVIFYSLIQKIGNYLEETFKNKNVMTRYF